MAYTKIFVAFAARPEPAPALFDTDAWEGQLYVFDDDGSIELAVNVALAASRPLLVLGKSGQGKSSLAAAVAWRMGWRFLKTTVTARTTAEDLLWQVDAVQRLADAQVQQLKDLRSYVVPGPLWWAIAPRLARRRGYADCELPEDHRTPRPPGSPQEDPTFDDRRAVVLIDEIDKADPDVPNALLGPLGSWRFDVRPIETEVTLATGMAPPLVVITSNDERALPAAFIRRCIVVRLAEADEDRLVAIAKARFPEVDDLVVQRIAANAVSQRDAEGRILISPAEVLNAVEASRELDIKDGKLFDTLLDYALSKATARS